jgi:hypothetical protein
MRMIDVEFVIRLGKDQVRELGLDEALNVGDECEVKGIAEVTKSKQAGANGYGARNDRIETGQDQHGRCRARGRAHEGVRQAPQYGTAGAPDLTVSTLPPAAVDFHLAQSSGASNQPALVNVPWDQALNKEAMMLSRKRNT